MKLSKLYTNRDDLFEPINFVNGFNAILAEIRLPENKKKDTHNLGKSHVGLVIDYCFLMKRTKSFFIFKHADLFYKFVFYLEVKLSNGRFLTIQRSANEASKISFKKHAQEKQNYSLLDENSWDHYKVSFDKAKQILDSYLDLRAVSPWSFRKGIGYHLRTQKDFGDVFKLSKFSGAHADWKPYIAHMLGFDANIIAEHYKKESELDKKSDEVKLLIREIGAGIDDLSKIEGILLLKREEVKNKQKLIDSFDFEEQDKLKISELVGDINEKITRINKEKYYLKQNRKQIVSSISDGNVVFDTEKTQKLFNEAGVLFKGQIKKDFDQLIEFNHSLTEERRKYLIEEKNEIDNRLKEIGKESETLQKQRSENLSFISDTNALDKYKEISDEIVILKSDIISLERQKEYIEKIGKLKSEIKVLNGEKDTLGESISLDVKTQNSSETSTFSQIRLYFSEIVEQVINRKALLSVRINKQEHIEFSYDILDETGNTTSAGAGYTYLKLLCIAFDMAIARAYKDSLYPHFIFHDGVFESLDDRKKENLIKIFRGYSQYGIQQIITLIDSDIPPGHSDEEPFINEDEVVLTLHDEGSAGRLFKMKTW